MSVTSCLRSIFAFRTGPATVLVVLLYAAAFVSLYLADQLQPLPTGAQQRAVLEQAYKDLHVIAARPRPYNSHQNDLIRKYLLRRVHDIARDYPWIHVQDDETTATFVDRNKAVYFEGNNILVKIDGTDDGAHSNGVLFSAHYDSVSTAPGATDDGMNVASLLQTIKHLAGNRPRLTAIFNINNGEEDGLHGAHSFLAHPWANITSRFINFEGAGAGGRPFLFRTTSLDMLEAFKKVPHPHANVISADAWKRGIIRSDTDYSVYAGSPDASPSTGDQGYKGPGGGMRGADVAFYKSRARYHTSDDSVRGMGEGGAKRALWGVMDVMRSAGNALLSSDGSDVVSETEGAVYFELFGLYLVAFPFRVLVAADTVLLAAGPIIVAVLSFFLYRQSVLRPQRRWVDLARGYGRFWLAFILSAGAQVGLVTGFLKLNPMTVHAHSVAVTLSMLSLSYLTLVIPLTLAEWVRPIPPAKQKLVVLVELYFLTWLLLLGAIVVAQQYGVAGTYWVGAWNASVLLAVVLAMIEGLWGKGRGGRVVLADESEDLANGEEETTQTAVEREEHEHESEEEVTERTPLITPANGMRKAVIADEEIQDQAFFWWIFQVVLSIPVPLISIGAISLIWLGAMPQTAPDGGWVGVVYAPLALLCLLLLLPLAPFAHKMHRSVTLALLLVFVASTAYSWLTWPFSAPDGKLKVFFGHRVELSNITRIEPVGGSSARLDGSPHLVSAFTELTVVAEYMGRVIEALPSSWSVGVKCEQGKIRPGMTTCQWPVEDEWLPSIPGNSRKDAAWFHVNATRIDASSSHFIITATNTRACSVRLENRNLTWYGVRPLGRSGSEDTVGDWREFEVPSGVNISRVDLWSREWGQSLELELRFHDVEKAEEEHIRGQVACTWAEYQDAERNGPPAARIPALEEAYAFLPEWAALTKVGDGLVEALSGFVL
ncbi:hypothetical protein FA95DRAFT_1554372 [Auriscalpium vulgare]|uniref:Uncharacterized protein n=1 Tax=Auriscalpium vulgare TaxID=40419 RepID=A0ACB8S5U4_9AGAM|nr:hypothetical protein FA95DRAFT_1554372 [Auriscalpium vulgare]